MSQSENCQTKSHNEWTQLFIFLNNYKHTNYFYEEL